MKNLILAAILCFSMILTGCQTNVEQPEINNQSTETNNNEEKLGVPFSNGPSNPPDVKGPNTPPPADTEESPQAVTQEEDIRLTLPLKTE
ncbi:MAG: hypothetical protein ACRCZE_01865 [Candidatus Altimarinota bacterium]